MMVKEQLTKNSHCADGNKSPKSNKDTQLMLLVNVLQLYFKIIVSLSHSVCLQPLFFHCVYPPIVLHHYDKSVNIDIISLHHDDSSSCRKPLINSACACMGVHVLVGVYARALPC